MTPIQASDIELSRNLNLTVTSLTEILNETLRKISESQKMLYLQSESEIKEFVKDAVKG